MCFALWLLSCWAKDKNKMTKLLVIRLQRCFSSELLSFVCRDITLQYHFSGAREGISHSGHLILSLLEFFTASIKPQTPTWFSTAVGWWGKVRKGKQKRSEVDENSGKGWEKDEQESPRQILCQRKILLLSQQLICFRDFFLCYPQPAHWGFLFF